MGLVRWIWPILVAIAALVAESAAAAEAWPSHTILVVSPFASGTTDDLVAHIVLDPAGAQIGQPFIIENRPGGGSAVGVASVVRALPNGYTLLLATSAMTTAVILHKRPPYDPVRDLAPVAMFGGEPSMLMAAPGKGYTSVATLVAASKAAPGKIKFGSVGIGSASHIAGERFSQLAGLDVGHVAYSGPAAALEDLAAGHIDFYFIPVTPALPLIMEGRAVPLAVSTPDRLQSLPGLPTLRESGYSFPTYLTWCGLAAPVTTPPPIVAKLNGVVAKILDMPAVQTKLLRIGFLPKPMTVDRYGDFVADDVATLVNLGKQMHIEPLD
jgi:tripartite-type tricarboxylate transporter receptor subunit TctC